MKATLYTPDGKRMGVAALKRHVQPGVLGLQGWRAGTHLGQPVLRSDTYPQDAQATRRRWMQLQDYIRITGTPMVVETNQREANALNGMFVSSNGGTYRLSLSEDGSRVVVLYGHGSVR